MAPHVQARHHEAIRPLDADGNGIPDFVEGMIQPAASGTEVSVGSAMPASRGAPVPASAPSATDTTNDWRLVLTGLLIFGLCIAGAAGVLYFFLR